MLTFPNTAVQGSPAGLCLYTVAAATEMNGILADGALHLQGTGTEQCNFGLRENLADAGEGTTGISGHISKDAHGVLEITFSPLGLAVYAKICQGRDYDLQPMLFEKIYRLATDWKVWPFHGDLLSQACNEQGSVLITSDSWRSSETSETCL